jgi:hypothetical protein
MTRSEQAIAIILYALGGAALCAIPFVFFPYSWMNAIHSRIGLGELPDVPIVSYLARSLSLFYAMFGTVSVYAAWNVRRHRSLVTLIAVMSVVLGFSLWGIDAVSRMPLHWTLVEGPFTILVGSTILWLQRQARRA